jgi:hypothetical protein
MFASFGRGGDLAVYDTMWRNIVELGRPQMKIWFMRIPC